MTGCFRGIKDVAGKSIGLITYGAGGGRDRGINLWSFNRPSTAF